MRHLLGGPAWHPRRPCTSPSCSYRVIALMRPAASRLGRSWSGCPAARRPPRRSSPKCRRASHRQEACLGWACIDGVQCDTRPRLRLGRHAAYVCCLQRLGTGACATAAAQGRAPPLLHPPHHTCRSKLLLQNGTQLLFLGDSITEIWRGTLCGKPCHPAVQLNCPE